MTVDVDTRAVLAARNNADLYAAVFTAQRLSFERNAYAFIGRDRPPAYYSDITMIAPGYGDAVADTIKARGGRIGIKDSFCELDPDALGLKVLFTASWIWRDATPHVAQSTWVRMSDPDHLERWEEAWKLAGSPTDQRMFAPTLLDRDDIAFLAAIEGGEVAAGCIANRSIDCVGLSNVFAIDPRPNLYGEAAAAVAAYAPQQPIVGYERGDNLNAALIAGFEVTGRLRVLASRPASP